MDACSAPCIFILVTCVLVQWLCASPMALVDEWLLFMYSFLTLTLKTSYPRKPFTRKYAQVVNYYLTPYVACTYPRYCRLSLSLYHLPFLSYFSGNTTFDIFLLYFLIHDQHSGSLFFISPIPTVKSLSVAWPASSKTSIWKLLRNRKAERLTISWHS